MPRAAPPADEAASAKRSSRRLLVRAGILFAITGTMIGLTRYRDAHAPRPASFGNFGHVPPFHLVDQSGAPFTDAALSGHVSVVDFIFTHCTASCPRLTASMVELQARLANEKSGARLVSFSVDPETDTPAVLKTYGATAHADFARWSFVTGPVTDVQNVVVSGFKVSTAKALHDAGDYDVTHGNWFVLVDGHGDIRGYYATDSDADIEKLASDVRRLERIAL